MDKILLTVFLSALAGFITTVLSIVKLVNEKESKTTEYRQAWTDSVRRSIATLIAAMNAQAPRLCNMAKVVEQLNQNHHDDSSEEAAASKRLRDHLEKSLSSHREAVAENKKVIYESYALSRLHFKPNDLSFNRIEQKFDVLEGLLSEITADTEEKKRIELKEKVHAGTNDLASYARDILKTEWETVKKGEPAYQKTKKWSIAGSIVTFFLLLSIGIHAAIAIWKENVRAETQYLKAPIETKQGEVLSPAKE